MKKTQKREFSKKGEKSPKMTKIMRSKTSLKRLKKLANKLVKETDIERQEEIRKMMLEEYYGEKL